MKKFKLTDENYFSKEAAKIYTGSSEIKNFLKCEAKTIAELTGEWIEEKSDSMLVSSYIDEAISGTLESFQEKHPEIFTSKKELKAQYKIANKVLGQIYDDAMFCKYLSGDHQTIMTGEISGVPVKIKIDSYFPDKAIIDLKAMKDLELIWNPKNKQKENFIDYFRYTLQASLYQEIVRQNTGKKLPFIIAVATKQEYSERALLSIPQEVMDLELEFLKQYLPHVKDLKEGKIEPTSCGSCNYCKFKYRTSKIFEYNYFFSERNKI